MGAYLSEPITDKESQDGEHEWLKFGASSMQGWRISQEDDHNCILKLKDDVALFAVYDGHGGKEVAKYTALKLPEFLETNELFTKGDYAEALKDAFLNFDKSITTPEVLAQLKEIVKNCKVDEEADSEDDDTVGNLREEAAMPLEAVMARYTSGKAGEPKKLKWGRENNVPFSPLLKAKRVGSTRDDECSSSTSTACPDNLAVASCSSSCDAAVSSSSTSKEISRTGLAEKYSNGEVAQEIPDSSGDVGSVEENGEKEKPVVNGGGVEEDAKEAEISSSAEGEQPPTPSKGKGKALIKYSELEKKKPVVSAEGLYKKFVSADDEAISDSEDSEDGNFVGAEGSSSDDEPTQSGDAGVEGKADDDEDDEDDDEEEEEDDEDEEEDDGGDDEFTMCMTDELRQSLNGPASLPIIESGAEEDSDDIEDGDESHDFAKDFLVRCLRDNRPGYDSGCTAVVALVLKDKVYVANAGDSRCIASKAGTAVELSFDHKPEDEAESSRIVKAGGKVTADGRVNGGLNLSRALGDHVYKQVANLPAQEQMISPMPDINELDITPDVEFLVLACDGIWNSMSSQEVVDFVRPRLLKSPEKLSTVCEELFNTCLAPHTMGDGTGCDNMTAIVVLFRGAELSPEVAVAKRRATSPSEVENKRAKTEGDEAAVSTSDFPDPAP